MRVAQSRQRVRKCAIRQIIFIDFEASSLSSASFPTELGWAEVLPDGAIGSCSYLIGPAAKWTVFANAWSAASERLTGISREMLDREGLPPAEVMKRFLAAVGDRDLFSDEVEFDQHWLGMLADVAGVDLAGRKIGDARKLIEAAGGDLGAAANSDEPRHRAGPDARRLALLYARAIAG